MPILTELTLYPIKSCAGIALREATLTSAGLMTQHIYDREWMVVDGAGEFLSQREHPRMALIRPRIKADMLELRAPGMMALEIPLDLPDPDDAPVLTVDVWGDRIKAYDCDETTATWFSKFLGVPCRLARFHPHAQRLASPAWTKGIEAPTLFSDGFPLLVISAASLADLNGRLQAQGRAPLTMDRFRPNIVIGDSEAFDEDVAASLAIGKALLKPVKPCARCSIPSVDQTSGVPGPDPMDILRTYRASAALDGAIAFGMNTILVDGDGQSVKIGQQVELTLAFREVPA